MSTTLEHKKRVSRNANLDPILESWYASGHVVHVAWRISSPAPPPLRNVELVRSLPWNVSSIGSVSELWWQRCRSFRLSSMCMSAWLPAWHGSAPPREQWHGSQERSLKPCYLLFTPMERKSNGRRRIEAKPRERRRSLTTYCPWFVHQEGSFFNRKVGSRQSDQPTWFYRNSCLYMPLISMGF